MVFCFVIDSSCFMGDYVDSGLTALDVCKCVTEHLVLQIKQKMGSPINYDKSFMLLETGIYRILILPKPLNSPFTVKFLRT